MRSHVAMRAAVRVDQGRLFHMLEKKARRRKKGEEKGDRSKQA